MYIPRFRWVQKPQVQHLWGEEFVLSTLSIGENLYNLCILRKYSILNDFVQNNSSYEK